MGSAHEKSLVIGRRGKTLLRVRRASIDNAVKQRARKKLFNVSDVFYPLPTTGKPPRDRRTEWTEERRKEQSRRLKQRWANRSEESKQSILARLKKAQNKSLENRRKLKAEIDDLVRRMDGSNETWSEIIDSINRTAIKEGNNPTRPPEKQLPETNEEYQN
uniref:Uncharacterized protein n=1 Tax=Cacopsylla melanoneura TaxID=428564 RepID=A0A8D8M3T4_9HEMI